jgi:hypothetical protein
MSAGYDVPGGVVRSESPPGRWRAVLRSRRLERTLWLVPLGIAAAYILVFVVRLPQNVRDLSWISDYAASFTVTETLAKTGTEGHAVLSSAGGYVLIWFGLLTVNLPFHRELWEIGPPILFLVSSLAVGWSVAQLTARRTALIAALVVLVASPLALRFLLGAIDHILAYSATALLGAYLVWLARARQRSRAHAIGVPLIAAAVLGVCLASDIMLGVSAVVPLTFTALLAATRPDRRSRRIAVSALATVLLAAAIAKLTSTVMGSLGFITLAPSFGIAPLSAIPGHVQLLFEGLKGLFNGGLGKQIPGTLHGPLGLACDIVMVAALLTLLLVGLQAMLALVWSDRHDREGRDRLAERLHIIYWFSSAVALCGAFLLTTRALPELEYYYLTVVFSVGAVLPLVLGRRTPARQLMLVGAAVFFAGSLVALVSYNLNVSAPYSRYGPTVASIAKANHVSVGYAGEWEGSNFTWGTSNRVLVRPIMNCQNPAGADICPFYFETLPSWYAPQHRHTFLLVDSTEFWLQGLPTGLGTPIAHYAFGPITMYIYGYDIASRLGP